MFKYKILTFISFLILFFILEPVFAKNTDMSLIGKIIIIDPGHGGKDPGTSNHDTLEKDINLAISKKLEKKLQTLGATTILTRTNDTDLSDPNASRRKKSDFDNRIELINNSKADIYLSIHLNYLPNKKYWGPQVFFQKDNEKSQKLAEIIQQELNANLKSDRDIKRIPITTYMYKKLKIDGVLIECGFLSNEEETRKLKDANYQQYLADIIASSLIKYWL